MAQPRCVALRIRFREADFAGASVLVTVNGHALPPYHAFGGDTRFDAVKDRPDLHPPVARLEANHVLVAGWVRAGANAVTIRNAGPGRVVIDAVTVRDIAGHDLPRYENPIDFDFDVWRQGVVMRPGVHWYRDTALLGVIPGGGAHVMNYAGGDGSALKPAAEEARVHWGFGRSTFYSIWHLANNAKAWAEFIDVDGNRATAGRVHSQFVNPPDVPPGTDIVLIKPDGYLNALKPGIDGLRAYTTDYNLTCEQWGPRGQGFGRWWGDRLAAKGFDARRWANNYQTEFGKVARYIHARNPGAPVMAPHWWMPDVRFLLYDTSLARGHRMRDMTDALMTHYYSFPFAGYRPDGTPVVDDDKTAKPVARPELQYPGGTFEPPDWEKSRPYMGTWALIPEIAIDWNRYRLGRTEKDMKVRPGVNPNVNRWGDGRPFDFRAGFDGDERSYNNETCVYDRHYSGPAPYQFLYAMFSYSLLPTAGTEAAEFRITRTLPLEPEAPPAEDIFSEAQQPVNRYGTWVAGAAGTHRLRTADPLYGDLFGYTGFEQATTGDYIWLCGIKERHHRRPGADAWNLVRRTCYAFVTAGPVYPAAINDPDSNHLFVKVLAVKQDGRDAIGLYAVNNDSKPHVLDVSLPAPWASPVPALVFDDRAGDWADGREQSVKPERGMIRYRVTVPPVSPWCVFVYPPADDVFRFAGGPRTPRPLAPWGDQNLSGPKPALTWKHRPAAGVGPARFEVQVAAEMLFRPEDVLLRRGLEGEEFPLPAGLAANRRYHWRVRAVDPAGRSSGWSRPQSFWLNAAAGAPVKAPPTPEAPAADDAVPRAAPPPALVPFDTPGNLARTGMPFAHPNYWDGPGKAVDGQAESRWVPDAADGEGRKSTLPAWWAVRFDAPQTVREATVLWAKDMMARDFEVQAWDGKAWRTVQTVAGNGEQTVRLKFPKPVETRAVRVRITAAVKGTVGLAEIDLR